MTKQYQAKLIRLAKEIESIGNINVQVTQEEAKKLMDRDCKLNYLLGFILGGEDDK